MVEARSGEGGVRDIKRSLVDCCRTEGCRSPSNTARRPSILLPMVVVFFISNADEAKEAFYGYLMLRGRRTSAGHVAWPALSSSCAEPPVCCLQPHLCHSRGRCAILELFFPAFLRCVSGRVIYGSTIWLSAWIWLVTISTQIREIGDFFCAVSPSQIPSHQNMVVWLKFFLKPGLDDLAVCRSCIFVGC
jgi:hypothetical protein